MSAKSLTEARMSPVRSIENSQHKVRAALAGVDSRNSKSKQHLINDAATFASPSKNTGPAVGYTSTQQMSKHKKQRLDKLAGAKTANISTAAAVAANST